MQPEKTSFEIEAVSLTVVSKRPSHLEQRLKSRDARVKSTSSAESLLQQAEAKRLELIEERRSKISDHLSHIQQAVQMNRQRSADDLHGLQQSLEKNQQSAAQKRTELLNSREQKFAKQVSRARDIAEKTLAKREEAVSKRKAQLEKRLKNSDMRRHMLLKIPRSKLLDENAIEAELIKYRVSVKRIQNWWQRILLRRLIQRYKLTNLHGDKVKNAKFEQLAPLLQNKRIIESTSALLSFLKRMSMSGRGRKYKNPSRVFLSAFLILYHPKEIIPESGEKETELRKAAERMITLFEAVLAFNFERVCEFVEAWHSYHMMFEEWKKADTEKILNYMFEHFMQLENLRVSVEASAGQSPEWQTQIELQQKTIKDKVMKIGGKSAFQRLINGQKEFRELSDASDAEVLADSPRKRVRNDSVRGMVELAKENDSQQSSSVQSVPQPPINETLSEFGAGMSNEALAHELVLNPDFELSPSTNSLEHQVREIAKKAFFDNIRREIANGKFSWVPGIVSDIKKQILDMLTSKNQIFLEISESLDSELITQQAEKNVFDFPRFVEFITSRMLQLCAPIRDAAIREIKEVSDIVKQLELILTCLDDMKLDLANFRLRSLRPHLLKQAVDYERSKFMKALDSNQTSLSRTKLWLQDAAKKLDEDSATRNPEKIESPDNKPRFDSVFISALLSLIFTPQVYSTTDLPETLVLDVERIQSYQNEAQAITVVASLLMLTKNFFQEIRDESAHLKELKLELFALLQSPTTTIPILTNTIVASVNRLLSRFGRKATEQQEQMVLSMVDKTLSYKDTVYTILNRRIMSTIRSHLTTGKLKVDGNNTGLDGVSEELTRFSQKVFILCQFNRDVYATWYDELLRDIFSESS